MRKLILTAAVLFQGIANSNFPNILGGGDTGGYILEAPHIENSLSISGGGDVGG